ncbi:MAG: hypothetical protein WCF57_21345 [Pyrinomonadaceae bacterium]
MLSETTPYSSFIDNRPFIQGRSQPEESQARDIDHNNYYYAAMSLTAETPEPEDPAVDAPLEDAARAERDYVRERLREELQREPTEEEVDQWLREHTEGY